MIGTPQDKKISVIVPVYNASHTIENCVESIRSQTYNNLEIILIDDCSSDNSLELCNKFADVDKRIKIIKHNENGGVSAARNTGIRHATGDYLGFVDSDDTIEPEMYQTMIASMQSCDAEICICQFKLKDCADGEARSIVDHSYVGVYENSYEMIRIMYNQLPARYRDILIQAVWNKLYRREVFDKIDFCGRYGEDGYISNRIFSKRYKVTVIGDEFYNYFYTMNENSLSHTATSVQRVICLNMYIDRCNMYNDQQIQMETMMRYCDLYLMFFHDKNVCQIVKRGVYAQKYREYIDKVWHFEKKDKGIPAKQKFKRHLAYISPNLHRFVMTAWSWLRTSISR